MNLSTQTLPSSLQGVPVVDMREKLPVNPSYTWISLKGPRKIAALTRIVFHHDGMAKSRSAGLSDEQFMRNIAQGHINSPKNIKGGDPGFPYHFYIRNGIVYYCNDLEAFTYGVASNNSDTVHISVAGHYAGIDRLEERDRRALYAAFFLVKQNLPNYRELKGHGELSPSDCPGFSMDKARADIAALDVPPAPIKSLDDRFKACFQALSYRCNLGIGKMPDGSAATSGQMAWGKAQILLLEREMKKHGLLE